VPQANSALNDYKEHHAEGLDPTHLILPRVNASVWAD
jgi:hypothetical protein